MAFTLFEAWIPADHAIEVLGGDKLNHGLAFGTLIGLAAMGYPRQNPVVIAICLSAVGAVIELVQGLPVINRDSDFDDWLADTTAIGIVLVIVAIVRWAMRGGAK